jgi:hypothetical protein
MPDFWGLKIINFGGPLQEKYTNYEYKIKYEREYLFIMRKEM